VGTSKYNVKVTLKLAMIYPKPTFAPTFADGYADAMQGLEPQYKDFEYTTGFNSLEGEVTSGFADIHEQFYMIPATYPIDILL
jgi:hypothetical protein